MDSQALDAVLRNCRSADPVLQSQAIMDLCREKVVAAVPDLVEVLTSPDPVVRANAAYALGQLGSHDIQTVVPELLRLLADPDSSVRNDAVNALGSLRYAPAIDPLLRMLQEDEDPLVRASAAEVIGVFGESRALTALLQALHDPDDSVRAFAANSIGLLGTPELLPLLRPQIESEETPRVRAELLIARYRLAEKEDLQQLLDMLTNADESLAIAILNGLEDLVSRKTPSTLSSDSGRIIEVLNTLGQRLPILRSHAQKIVERLNILQRRIGG